MRWYCLAAAAVAAEMVDVPALQSNNVDFIMHSHIADGDIPEIDRFFYEGGTRERVCVGHCRIKSSGRLDQARNGPDRVEHGRMHVFYRFPQNEDKRIRVLTPPVKEIDVLRYALHDNRKLLRRRERGRKDESSEVAALVADGIEPGHRHERGRSKRRYGSHKGREWEKEDDEDFSNPGLHDDEDGPLVDSDYGRHSTPEDRQCHGTFDKRDACRLNDRHQHNTRRVRAIPAYPRYHDIDEIYDALAR